MEPSPTPTSQPISIAGLYVGIQPHQSLTSFNISMMKKTLQKKAMKLSTAVDFFASAMKKCMHPYFSKKNPKPGAKK